MSSVQGFSWVRCFFPNIDEAPKQKLKEYQATIAKVRNITGSILIGSSGLTFLKLYLNDSKKDDPNLAGMASVFLCGAVALTTLKITNTLEHWIVHIDQMCNAENLSFEELYSNGILGRISWEAQRARFKEHIENIKKENTSVSRKDGFIKMSRNFNLFELVKEGIASPENCDYRTFQICLEDISHNELENLFPLKAGISLLPQLQTACAHQKNLYQILQPISAQFPDRYVGCSSGLEGNVFNGAYQQKWKEAIQELKLD